MKKIGFAIVVLMTSLFLFTGKAYAGELPEIHQKDVTYYRDDETGKITAVFEQDFSSTEEYPNIEAKYIPRQALSGAYGSLEDIVSTFPDTRDQSPYGTCWAFSAAACAEFDLIKNHGMTRELDLSELQLIYFMYHSANDRKGNLDGDRCFVPNECPDSFLDVGGTADLYMYILAAGKGFTSESNIPYASAQEVEENRLDESYAYQDNMAMMTDAIYLDIINKPKSVKKAIENYGAVSVGYYSSEEYYSEGTDGQVAYYCPEAYYANHDVVIVGWDDEFSLDHFTTEQKPTSPGAWLIRNSWTTETGASADSYFWISYEDLSVGPYAYAFNYELAGTYDNIYQHDGSPTSSYVEVEAVANVFSVDCADGVRSEILEAVMIPHTAGDEETFIITVRTGVSDGLLNGVFREESRTEVTISKPGIHTVQLANPVYLKDGEKFAVCVSAKDGKAYFEIEDGYLLNYYDEEGNRIPWFATWGSLEEGESYYRYRGCYYDLKDEAGRGQGNARIKALTRNSDMPVYKLSYKDTKMGKLEQDNPTYYYEDMGTIVLNNPVNEHYHFVGWYTSDGRGPITELSGDLGGDLDLKTRYRRIKYFVTAEYRETVYDGTSKKPSVSVVNEYGVACIHGKNCFISYDNNVEVGVAKIIAGIYMPDYQEQIETFLILPVAPTKASASLSGHDDVKFSWEESKGASGYRVYFKKASNKNYTVLGDTKDTAITKKNLLDGVKYTFKVVPYFEGEDGVKHLSPKSKTASVTTLKKMEDPKVSLEGNKVKVSWTNITGETGYQISRSSKQNGTNVVTTYKTTSGTTKSVSATPGTAFYYKVRAYKEVNGVKVFGPWSNPVRYIRKIAAPTEVVATLRGHDDIRVTWGKVEGAVGYSVYYKKVGASSYTFKGNTTKLSMEIENLSDGVQYNVKVVPYSKVDGKIQRGPNYEVVSIYTLKKIATPTVTGSDGKVKVSWKNINGETGYQISRSTKKTGTYIASTFTSTTATSRLVKATVGETYYYKVRAYTIVDGEKVFGPWSEPVKYTLK